MKWDELSGNDDDGDRCNDHTDRRYRTTSFHRRFETAALLPQNPNPAWKPFPTGERAEFNLAKGGRASMPQTHFLLT